MTFPFQDFLEFKKDLLQAQLKVIYRYQQNVSGTIPKKRTSKLTIVEDILKNAGKPLHISKIIEIAKNEYIIDLERDSTVSAMIKKIKAGKIFVRVAPNTFSLKTD